MIRRILLVTGTIAALLLTAGISKLQAQDASWHGKQRTLHYQPRGNDFILYQGSRKFNRALYGTHSGFRVETGDVPEFALYMPGMGGNCKIGIIRGQQSKWLTTADSIQTIYRPGSMLYTLSDRLLGTGNIRIAVLALAASEGMVLKITGVGLPDDLRLLIAYGGASGKKFSRDGDIGADPPTVFDLQPVYCRDNEYRIQENIFCLQYGFTPTLSQDQRYEIQTKTPLPDSRQRLSAKQLWGVLPQGSRLKRVDPAGQASPLQLLATTAPTSGPMLAASFKLPASGTAYFMIENGQQPGSYRELAGRFSRADQARRQLAGQVVLETPDAYINPLGGALSVAADAIWEAPSYLHGAVAWRMRLPAWRGAYVADALGWRDRARSHFDSYLKSQVRNIPPGPVEPDSSRHFARQVEKMGNAMFSNGYICRYPDGKIQPHHYDMNLVFFDQLLTHLQYGADTAYIRRIWPAFQSHLQWEKRNFDPDNDGLFDAYACIWASDALQYSGGKVTHSTAYNYRAFKLAARLAAVLGEDSGYYAGEVRKISQAMQQQLWSPQIGAYGEYRDRDGLQRLHTAPALWSLYHPIDAGIPDPLQSWQMLSYIDRQIPHIPVKARELDLQGLYLLSTSNWQPYTWSVNNVALAENLQTALAYWQSGASKRAFQLWKSALVESMYLSASPGGFEQLSFYDAVRGELYRDFADPIGVAARTLTEGLFGIRPAALEGLLRLRPGWPAAWDHARLKTPDIEVKFNRQGRTAVYHIHQNYEQLLDLQLQVPARSVGRPRVWLNDQPVAIQWVTGAMGGPLLEIRAGKASHYRIKIQWAGDSIYQVPLHLQASEYQSQTLSFGPATLKSVRDLHQSFDTLSVKGGKLHFRAPRAGSYPLLLELIQGERHWQQLVTLRALPRIQFQADTTDEGLLLQITNQTNQSLQGQIRLRRYETSLQLAPGGSRKIPLPGAVLDQGSNPLLIKWQDGYRIDTSLTYWSRQDKSQYEVVRLDRFYNARLSATFQQQYLEPRPAVTTLQIPWQGIGNWCYPLIAPAISEAGIRGKDWLYLHRIPFQLGKSQNIAFTSLWKNYPEAIRIPLSGKASHIYLLMAGTTNHQQSQLANGMIDVHYTDGSRDSLPLINPLNWWPLEQDYRDDGYAFRSAPRPWRLLLATGKFSRDFSDYTTIKGFTDLAIAGGAATVLDLPVNPEKQLAWLRIRTLSNEVLVGLMSLSLKRPATETEPVSGPHSFIP